MLIKHSKVISFSWHHSEQDQGSSESVEIQVFFGYLSILGVLLSVKYQGIGISLLEEHKGIIYFFVIVISIYVGTIIVGKKLGPIRLLSATIAPILLFVILVPELGWPALGLWVILVAKLTWDYELWVWQMSWIHDLLGEEDNDMVAVSSPMPILLQGWPINQVSAILILELKWRRIRLGQLWQRGVEWAQAFYQQ